MNQFDQEIKNRINSHSYEYKPQAWRSFKHRSGMPMMSVGAKLALTAASVAIVGGVLYVTLSSTPDNPETTTFVNEIQNTDNQQNDTINLAEYVAIDNTEEDTIEPSHPTPIITQPQTTAQTQATVETSTESNPVKPQPKPIPAVRPVYYGRPLEILVDTISSIDFPDYEVRPADMLP